MRKIRLVMRKEMTISGEIWVRRMMLNAFSRREVEEMW